MLRNGGILKIFSFPYDYKFLVMEITFPRRLSAFTPSSRLSFFNTGSVIFCNSDLVSTTCKLSNKSSTCLSELKFGSLLPTKLIPSSSLILISAPIMSSLTSQGWLSSSLISVLSS